MGCGCGGKKKPQSFVWTSSDGSQTKQYNTEVEAKAQQIRKGGTYTPA